MVKRSPYVIVCPSCLSLRVNRKHGTCGSCGVRLVYAGEYWGSDDIGYLYIAGHTTGAFSNCGCQNLGSQDSYILKID